MPQNKKDSTVATSTACAIVFCLFSFLYIYCYQTPTLAYEQHVLSGGVTVYHPLVSAILITLAGHLLQFIVYSLTRLRGASHALTYLPSMLLLSLLTSAHPDGNGELSMGAWTWLLPLIIILYFCLINVIKQWISVASSPAPYMSSHVLQINLFTMVAMMLFTLNVCNGDELFHRQIRAEKLLLENRYAELSKEGQGRSLLAQRTGITFFDSRYNSNSERTDSILTLMRFIAMDHQGTLADSAFTQPVVGGVRSLIQQHDVHPLLFSRRFLIRRKSFDYRLCALLAERDLDTFARLLSSKVNVNDSTARDSLPRHYKEALVLYQHLRSKPLTAYNDPVLETDYRDMRDMQKKCVSVDEKKQLLRQSYQNNYWNYYGELYLESTER